MKKHHDIAATGADPATSTHQYAAAVDLAVKANVNSFTYLLTYLMSENIARMTITVSKSVFVLAAQCLWTIRVFK